jgi:hypothetical protein
MSYAEYVRTVRELDALGDHAKEIAAYFNGVPYIKISGIEFEEDSVRYEIYWGGDSTDAKRFPSVWLFDTDWKNTIDRQKEKDREDASREKSETEARATKLREDHERAEYERLKAKYA